MILLLIAWKVINEVTEVDGHTWSFSRILLHPDLDEFDKFQVYMYKWGIKSVLFENLFSYFLFQMGLIINF